ncbi:MAG: NAD-dependent protein deacylase [Verrucomicrobiota bacterium]
MLDAVYNDVARCLQRAERILFITGAGVSADSGLPTYRGVGGLYNGKDTDEGYAIEEALSGSMLRNKPEVAWKYLWQIASACRGRSFNRSHEVMAEIENLKPETWVLTQNIDGFHKQAGTKNLIEIHGRASELFCLKCGLRGTAKDWINDYTGQPKELPPVCPECDGLIRPDVVLFGETLPDHALQKLNQIIFNEKRDMVFVVGTTGVFPYIAQPVFMAGKAGIPTVEINPARTDLSDVVQYRIEAGAAEALDKIWKIAQKKV